MEREKEKKKESLEQEQEKFGASKKKMQQVKLDIEQCLSHAVFLIQTKEFRHKCSENFEDLLVLYGDIEKEMDRAIEEIEEGIECLKKDNV